MTEAQEVEMLGGEGELGRVIGNIEGDVRALKADVQEIGAKVEVTAQGVAAMRNELKFSMTGHVVLEERVRSLEKTRQMDKRLLVASGAVGSVIGATAQWIGKKIGITP